MNKARIRFLEMRAVTPDNTDISIAVSEQHDRFGGEPLGLASGDIRRFIETVEAAYEGVLEREAAEAREDLPL